MKQLIFQYSTLVFDCDGVVLNSNKVKTDAFFRAVLPYGKTAAEAMVVYHVANGGVSRYKKFKYFLQEIVPDQRGPNLDELLKAYAAYVRKGLLNCEIAPGLKELRQHTCNARWLIVSGGDQSELRDIFSQRELLPFFDGGIFGSPNTKDEILEREVTNGSILEPALFLGDSKYDYQAASRKGLDFVFLHGWSEIQNYDQWCSENKIATIESLTDLLPYSM